MADFHSIRSSALLGDPTLEHTLFFRTCQPGLWYQITTPKSATSETVHGTIYRSNPRTTGESLTFIAQNPNSPLTKVLGYLDARALAATDWGFATYPTLVLKRVQHPQNAFRLSPQPSVIPPSPAA